MMADYGKRFIGKVCLVTGGGSGIGQATCERMAQEGGRMIVVDLHAGGAETAAGIERSGGAAIFVQTDVSDSVQVRAAIAQGIERWGKIDVLVNDAATMTFDSILDLAEADWDRVLAVNLRSVFLLCKYAVPHIPPGGAIVNLSSVHAHATTKTVVPYATSKGGIEAFTRGFSEEMAEKKIRVNSVAPGAVDTPMLWENPNIKSGAEKVSGAVGSPADLAGVICFLASDEACFITGTTLIADGGRLDSL